MDLRNDISNTIVNAQAEQSHTKCVSLFKEALLLCDEWGKDNIIDSLIAKATIFEELAYENEKPKERSENWKSAIKTLNIILRTYNNHKILEKFCVIAVSCNQDDYCDLMDKEKLNNLRNSKKYLDNHINEEKDLSIKSLLLCRKSSILRHLALYEISHQQRKKIIEESIRCASLSLKYKKNSGGLFQLAMSEWSIARYQKNDFEFYNKIRHAETLLLNCDIKDTELRDVSLARFYKQIYRPLDACKVFTRITNHIKNKRRVLRCCDIYAESVISLWFAGYPKEIIKKYLKNAIQVTEAAISAGYLNARNIINLSFLISIQQGGNGNTLINELTSTDEQISWDKAIKIVSEGNKKDLLSYGFSLGIHQSAIWNKLGTYANTFLKNEKLTMSLYRTAIKMNPSNFIALTNLAKLLVLKGGKKNIDEASWLISRVQNLADKRFRWWRPVMDLINKQSAQPLNLIETVIDLPIEKKYTKLSALRSTFKKIKQLTNTQKRGFELERLFYGLTKITFGEAHSSYKATRAAGSKSQIDSYFEYEHEEYRVECKWLKKEATHNDIIIFSDKLNAFGVSGVFISMKGFTESAINRAKELAKEKVILLCDGEEMNSIFLGEINLDEVISLKRLHFNQYTNPYFKVIDSTKSTPE